MKLPLIYVFVIGCIALIVSGEGKENQGNLLILLTMHGSFYVTVKLDNRTTI